MKHRRTKLPLLSSMLSKCWLSSTDMISGRKVNCQERRQKMSKVQIKWVNKKTYSRRMNFPVCKYKYWIVAWRQQRFTHHKSATFSNSENVIKEITVWCLEKVHIADIGMQNIEALSFSRRTKCNLVSKQHEVWQYVDLNLNMN